MKEFKCFFYINIASENIYMISVFGLVRFSFCQNHMQTKNRIFNSVWFDFGKFDLVTNSTCYFLVRFDFVF